VAFMVRMNESQSAVTEPFTTPEPAEETFEVFFERNHARLLRGLYLGMGNAQEAEEIMQDAFLAVWERWDRVREMDDPTGYLFRAAMNRSRSRVRRATRAARRTVGRAESRDAFADVEDRETIGRALAAVSPRQRAALVLTEYLGYPSEEAGKILGIKAVTVRALASQGRAAMKTELESDDE
jgi:RNA polymerase sigma factor (sigma-70 family)